MISAISSAGSVVCRNTVAQAFGCTPFNPFSGQALTAGQIAYFDGQNGPGGTTIGPTAIQTQRQEAFSFQINGSPIDTWAGDFAPGPDPERRSYASLADFADPDGNTWILQEIRAT